MGNFKGRDSSMKSFIEAGNFEFLPEPFDKLRDLPLQYPEPVEGHGESLKS
jgi:hypothetical protein